MISLVKISEGQVRQTMGYAFYQDSLASNLTVTTTPTRFTVDGLGSQTFKDELPYDVTDLWSSDEIKASGLNDAYDSRIGLKVNSDTGTPTILNFVVDIGGLTTPTIPIHETTLQLDKTPPFTKGYSVPLFSRDTFLSNDAQIFVFTDTGTVTITNRSIFLIRLYKSI